MGLLELDKQATFAIYDAVSSNQALIHFFLYLAALVVYILPVILLYLFFKNGRDRLNSIKIFLATVITWRIFSNGLGILIYNLWQFRDRPFAETGLQELFLEQPTKAFPSDHAAVLTIVAAMCFFLGYKRLGWIFVIAGTLSVFGRVAVGFHYIGDIFGGIAVGLIAFALFYYLDSQIERLVKSVWRRVTRKELGANDRH